MTRNEIIATTEEFLVEEFEVEASEIVDDANMHETMDLDSLDYVDLVVTIQNNFGFKLGTEDFKSIRTFNDFYNLIEERLKTGVS